MEPERTDPEYWEHLSKEEVAIELAKLEQQEKQQTPAVCDNGKARPVKQIKTIEAVTAAALDTMNIPPVEWLVDNILPVGISMIGAPSKYYKSFICR